MNKIYQKASKEKVSPWDSAFSAEGSEGSEGSKGSEGVVSPLEPLRGDEFYNSASQNGKPNNRASPDGNAPLLVLRTTSPGGGSLSVSIE